MSEYAIPIKPEPVLTPRACGGWLAVSGPDEVIRIGVVAETEQAVREAFDASASRWIELLRLAQDRSLRELEAEYARRADQGLTP